MSVTVQTTISESVVLQQSSKLDHRTQLKLKCREDHRERYWATRDQSAYVCPMCDRPGRREFDVHHIDGDWLNGHPMNLVAICSTCHRRTHRLVERTASLEAWKQGFEALGTPETRRYHSD